MAWDDMVMDLVEQSGIERTLQVLYQNEKPGVLVWKKGKHKYQCPVCEQVFWGEDTSFCQNCGAHFFYDSSESEIYEPKEWKEVFSVHNESVFLVFNILGEKYLANYDKKSKNFIDEYGKNEYSILGFLPIHDEKKKNVLRQICERKQCTNCCHLMREGKVYICPYENECGPNRYNEPIPIYKLPKYKEKRMKCKK